MQNALIITGCLFYLFLFFGFVVCLFNLFFKEKTVLFCFVLFLFEFVYVTIPIRLFLEVIHWA